MNDKYRSGEILHNTYPVGRLVTIGKSCMGNELGSKGVVYENYTIGKEHFGCSIIFENGSYDGFSENCLEILEVNPIGFIKSVSDYKFSNVTRLSIDFKEGRFKKAFQ